MSNLRDGEDGSQQEQPGGFSLTKAVEDVSQHGFAQTEALKDKQRTLCSLQEILSDVEKKAEVAAQELRSKVREMLMLEDDMEHLERQTNVLRLRCASGSRDNAELLASISEGEESTRTAREGFNAYRQKMKAHRAAALHAASQTEAFRALQEKRELVKSLTQRREELREDLESPNGNTVQTAKREIDALKGEIFLMRETTAEKRKRLEKEFQTQTQIRKDIEIQNRRFEAIIKRLHCQLSRSQAMHRQMFEDIDRMERQLAELQSQLKSPDNLAVGDH